MARETTGIADLTAKGRRTRERIIAAGLTEFARAGSNATSLRTIAAAAGLSHPAVLRYFRDKDELLLAVLERRDSVDLSGVFDEDDRVQPAYLTPEGGRRVLQGLMRVIERNTTMPTMVELYLKVASEATHPDHPAHAYFVRRYERLRRLLAQVLEAAMPPGRPNAPSPEQAAEQLIAILDGSQLQWLLMPDKVSLIADAERYVALLGIDLEADADAAEVTTPRATAPGVRDGEAS